MSSASASVRRWSFVRAIASSAATSNGPRHGLEQGGELLVEAARELRVERERRALGGAGRGGARTRRAERAQHAREDDRDEVVAEAEGPRLRARLAPGYLLDDPGVARVESLDGRGVRPSALLALAHARKDGVGAEARAEVHLVGGGRVEQPEVVHEEEREHEPQPVEVPVPLDGAHEQHRRRAAAPR